MPVYSPTYQEYSTSMLHPMGFDYGSAMMAAGHHGYGLDSHKHSLRGYSGDSANFSDFDDDPSNYYVRNRGSKGSGELKQLASAYANSPYYHTGDGGGADMMQRRSDEQPTATTKSFRGSDESPLEGKGSVDEPAGGKTRLVRAKRQVYESSYEHEPPCYGFPLEINIKSRIKLDQVFPIYGKSQHKKCIKVGRPLLPPVEDSHPHPY